LYVYWGIALTLLISTAAFCWLVVVPILEARTAVAGASNPRWNEEGTVRDLGGTVAAARKLSLYLRTPLPTPDERSYAVAVLGFCGRSAVPALIREMADQDEASRRGVMISIRRIGPEAKEATAALAVELAGKNPAHRQLAARAIVAIGPDAAEAAPALAKALADANSNPGLRYATEGPEMQRDIRDTLVAALQSLGPKAAVGSSALEHLLEDENSHLRQPARKALWKIQPGRRKRDLATADRLYAQGMESFRRSGPNEVKRAEHATEALDRFREALVIYGDLLSVDPDNKTIQGRIATIRESSAALASVPRARTRKKRTP